MEQPPEEYEMTTTTTTTTTSKELVLADDTFDVSVGQKFQPILACRLKPSFMPGVTNDKKISQPTIDTVRHDWSKLEISYDEKNVKVGAPDADGVVMAFGRFNVLNIETGEKFEARFVFKDKRALKSPVKKFANGGDTKFSVAVPLCMAHGPDAILFENLEHLQMKVYEALRCSRKVNEGGPGGLGWHNLNDQTQISGKPLLENISWQEGEGWYQILLKWDKMATGFEPGQLWNMTKQRAMRKNGAAKSLIAATAEPTTPDGFRVNTDEPQFYVANLLKGHGIDGTFAVTGWWANNRGDWGLTTSIRAMRVYPPESFESPLAELEVATASNQSQYDFDY